MLLEILSGDIEYLLGRWWAEGVSGISSFLILHTAKYNWEVSDKLNGKTGGLQNSDPLATFISSTKHRSTAEDSPAWPRVLETRSNPVYATPLYTLSISCGNIYIGAISSGFNIGYVR